MSFHQNPENDVILFEYGILTPLSQFRMYILGTLKFFLSGLVVTAIISVVVLYVPKLWYLILLIWGYVFIFIGFHAAIFAMIALSLMSALFFEKNLDKVYFTDKGIYLLQSGGIGAFRTMLRLIAFQIRVTPLGFLVGRQINKLPEMMAPELLYNFTAWNKVMKITINNEIGTMLINEKRMNDRSVGAVWVEKNNISKILNIVREYAKNCEIVAQ